MTYNGAGETTTVHGLWSTLLTFTYDADGNRTGIQDNFGGVTTNSYDAVGNLTRQQFGGTGQTPMRIDLAYDAAGELTSETRYSDLAGTTEVAGSTFTYDAAGDLTHQLDKNSSGTPLASYTYTYDADGRVTSQTVGSSPTVTYTYDNDSQLTSDTTSTQTYDATGNRDGGSNTVGTDNQLTSDGTWDYTYDAAGNETYKVNSSSGVTWEYGYDDKNELISAEEFSRDPRIYDTGLTVLEDVSYKYDAWGNLVERDDGVSSPTVTRYAVDGWDPALAGTTGNTRFNVRADLDASNNLLTRYFHGDQRDQLFGRQDSLTAFWYLTDRQGSVREVLDNSGNIKDAITYDGWGNITGETDCVYRGQYTWTGRQFDAETDLQYNRARWYDPATGRWMSQDPLGFDAGDSNLYRYVNDAPTISDDPSGLARITGAEVIWGGTDSSAMFKGKEYDRQKTFTELDQEWFGLEKGPFFSFGILINGTVLHGEKGPAKKGFKDVPVIDTFRKIDDAKFQNKTLFFRNFAMLLDLDETNAAGGPIKELRFYEKATQEEYDPVNKKWVTVDSNNWKPSEPFELCNCNKGQLPSTATGFAQKKGKNFNTLLVGDTPMRAMPTGLIWKRTVNAVIDIIDANGKHIGVTYTFVWGYYEKDNKLQLQFDITNPVIDNNGGYFNDLKKAGAVK
jgi:RHS repeat-associated protein